MFEFSHFLKEANYSISEMFQIAFKQAYWFLKIAKIAIL